VSPRYVIEEWAGGLTGTTWKQIGGEVSDRAVAVAAMQQVAETDVHAYGPVGYLRLRVRETSGSTR
jgi:hypothetical protein